MRRRYLARNITNKKTYRLTGKPGVVGRGVPASASHISIVWEIRGPTTVALDRGPTVQRDGVRIRRHPAGRTQWGINTAA